MGKHKLRKEDYDEDRPPINISPPPLKFIKDFTSITFINGMDIESSLLVSGDLTCPYNHLLENVLKIPKGRNVYFYIAALRPLDYTDEYIMGSELRLRGDTCRMCYVYGQSAQRMRHFMWEGIVGERLPNEFKGLLVTGRGILKMVLTEKSKALPVSEEP